MQTTFKRCAERDELEKKIRTCLGKISALSRDASRYACRERANGSAEPHTFFQELQKEHVLLSTRLAVLNECLELHKNHHLCGWFAPQEVLAQQVSILEAAVDAPPPRGSHRREEK